MSWLQNLSGSRTYLSAGGAILTAIATACMAIATAVGTLDLQSGTAVTSALGAASAACIALAQIFQRAATANNFADVQEIMGQLKNLVNRSAIFLLALCLLSQVADAGSRRYVRRSTTQTSTRSVVVQPRLPVAQQTPCPGGVCPIRVHRNQAR